MTHLAFADSAALTRAYRQFWIDALLNAAIPVVRGGLSDADYWAVAPPGSYINADSFDSPAALAAHMRAVASNYTLFASYHAWRLTHRLLVTDRSWASNHLAEQLATCRLCEWLHAHQHALPQARLNLTEFWSGKTHCRLPTDVPHAHMLLQPTYGLDD